MHVKGADLVNRKWNFYMKKKIFFIAIAFMLLTIQEFCCAGGSNIKYYDTLNTVKIKGKTDAAAVNRFVSVVLKSGEAVKAIGETQIDAAGQYEYLFKETDISDDAELMVKCGDENITSTVYEALITMREFVQVPFNIVEDEETFTITADFAAIAEKTDKFTVAAAQYDKKGNLVSCNVFESKDLPDIVAFNQDIDKKGIPKLFVWTSVTELIPAALLTENGGQLVIKFGMKADKQQREGYIPAAGENNYQRYKNAVNELPDEFSVIKEQKPNIKRAFFVAGNGSDSAEGTKEAPFATVSRALEEYAGLTEDEKKEWSAIYIRGGEYELTEPISLTYDIAGEYGSAKLFIGAYNNESVMLKSTRTVTGDKLTRVSPENTSNEIISRINDNAEVLYYVSYSDLGIEKMEGYEYGTSGKKPVLTYNGKAGILARYPNGGDTYIYEVLDSGYDDEKNYTENVEFIPTDKKPFTWQPSNEIGISGQLCVTWYYNHMQSTFDYEKSTVKTPARQTVSQGNRCAVNLVNHPEDKAHFYYYNVFEEIDMPGEWCSSDAEQRIYIYPEGGTVNPDDEIKISGPLSDYAIKAENISDLIIDSILFDTVKRGISFSGCERAAAQNCKFNNISGHCALISECKSSGIINSDFTNSYSGISISGGKSDIINLSPSRNFIQNCYLNQIEATCINIGESCGNIVSHNLAENYRGSFVGLFGGCENVIEYNETYAGGLNGNEAYIIYVDGQFTARNNHIRYNYIHDASPDAYEILLGVGVAFDDLGENNYAYQNVFKNMSGGVSVNGGDNNIIDGNVMIDSKYSAGTTDKMYGNEMLYGESMLNDTESSRLLYKYYRYGLFDNTSWIRRYPYASDRIAYLEAASKIWNTGDTQSDGMLFARAATGNYVINNTVINSPDVSIGPNYTDYISYTDPSGEVPDYEGNDYSVMYGNSVEESIPQTGLEIIQKAGLSREHSYKDTAAVNMIYPNSTDVYKKSNVLDICWEKKDVFNFYRITVASDAEFKNTIAQKWLIDNRYMQTVQTYPLRDVIYYYKIEAYNYGISKEALAVSQTGSVTFAPYEQTEDIAVISPDKSNLAQSWRGALGTQYIRSIIEGAEPEQKTENGEQYIRISAPAGAENFRTIWGKYAYDSVEKFDAAYDTNTVLSMEMKVRFPDENSFGAYADIPAPQMSPCGTAADKSLGEHGKMLSFRISSSEGKYILYSVLSGTSNSAAVLGEYTSDELFGRWITVKIDIDVKTGMAAASFDGIETSVDMNYTTWGESYRWNSENYLRFFDLVLNNSTSDEFIIDVKDVNVIRKVA